MQQLSPSPQYRSRRRGLTTPMVACALLVAMLGMALVLDRLWLEAARLELVTAAEAAALAGARELASDHSLTDSFDPQLPQDDAIQAAMMTAVRNQAVGQPVVIGEADIQFPADAAIDPGDSLAADSFAASSLKSVATPRTIRVQAHRTRFRGNPIALFIGELTGQPFGDAVGQAAASINGPVVGVRPLAGATVPALPFAIWRQDPTGQRTDTWQVAIEQRRGRDDFRYDESTKQVVAEPDGIPELTVFTVRPGGPAAAANLQVLDVGTQLQDDQLARQIQSGWTPGDLEQWGGELRLPATDAAEDSLVFAGLPQLESADRDALEQILGEQRVALLYSTAVPAAGSRLQDVTCVRLVAIRILNIADQNDGSCRVTVQPTVLATRTALIAPSTTEPPEVDEANATAPREYLYQLQLTQ